MYEMFYQHNYHDRTAGIHVQDNKIIIEVQLYNGMKLIW